MLTVIVLLATALLVYCIRKIVLYYKYKRSIQTFLVYSFFVKVSFSFIRKYGWLKCPIGCCSYYRISDLEKKAEQAGMTYEEYIATQHPYFSFDGLQPLTAAEMRAIPFLPLRYKATMIDLKKHTNLLMTLLPFHVALITIAKKDDPFKCYWVGICTHSNDTTFVKRVMKEYKKRGKENASNIVQS